MTTSALRRQVKNIVHNYSEAEIKVREATSNDPWGPPSSLMSEIADLTFNTVAFAEVMGMIWRRLNDSGKNWRHVYKALTLLDYLIKTGSEKVAHQCRENLYTIQTLKEFQYIDRDGKDQGINVREKVKQVMSLLKDEDRLKQERAYALKTKERMSSEGMGISSSNSNSHQLAYGRRASQYGDDYSRSRGSPSSFNSSSSSPRFSSDLEQARPQTTGEEELQLQLALAMSREEAEKPLPPVSSTDEDLQLQIALTLSKQEHEKEVRAWKGENSLLQKALEESNLGVEEVEEDDKEKKTQSSVLELADIFGPAPVTSTHTSADPWDIPGGGTVRSVDTDFSPPALSLPSSWDHNNTKSPVESTGTSWGPAADPWVPLPSEDPLTHSSASQASSSPWNLPPVSSASDPWGIKSLPSGVSSTDPWGKQSPPAPLSASVTSAADPWGGSTDNSSAPDNSTFDLFAKLPESVDQPEHESSQAPSSVKANSSGDVDLFGDLIPSTAENGIQNKDIFDIASLGDSLPDSKEKDNKTPETFLGPNASSLVNLDSLVTVPQSMKSRNPFLAGLSAPSPTNPFNVDQPKPTLNQMRTNSPVPSVPMGMPMNSMTYSASLPLPLSSIPSTMTLPASVSAFPQAGAGPFPELPSNLPQPLLPLSGSVPSPLASQSGMNPFL
ncbi:epsin-3 isoform X2 [Ahaetulla prasina]|uniref:epsin-3 isoform X2 n=1 Tax=Ahaetulla prasina TaxID=499056 RepID=UPI002649CC00|nr:epsin-3 isoform X2 [Ahaetulla prasina]